jgi:hypothetical protein
MRPIFSFGIVFTRTEVTLLVVVSKLTDVSLMDFGRDCKCLLFPKFLYKCFVFLCPFSAVAFAATRHNCVKVIPLDIVVPSVQSAHWWGTAIVAWTVQHEPARFLVGQVPAPTLLQTLLLVIGKLDSETMLRIVFVIFFLVSAQVLPLIPSPHRFPFVPCPSLLIFFFLSKWFPLYENPGTRGRSHFEYSNFIGTLLPSPTIPMYRAAKDPPVLSLAPSSSLCCAPRKPPSASLCARSGTRRTQTRRWRS